MWKLIAGFQAESIGEFAAAVSMFTAMAPAP